MPSRRSRPRASVATDQGRRRPQRAPDGRPRPTTCRRPGVHAGPDESPLDAADGHPGRRHNRRSEPQPTTRPSDARRCRSRAGRIAPQVAAGPVRPPLARRRPPRRPMRTWSAAPSNSSSALRRLGDRGGTMRIASGCRHRPADGRGLPRPRPIRSQIVAEAGGVRPRLRFRPSPVPGDSPADWIGPLQPPLRLAPAARAGPDRPRAANGAPAERLAAIAVSPGYRADPGRTAPSRCAVRRRRDGAGRSSRPRPAPPASGPSTRPLPTRSSASATVSSAREAMRSWSRGEPAHADARRCHGRDRGQPASRPRYDPRRDAEASRKVSLDVRIDRVVCPGQGRSRPPADDPGRARDGHRSTSAPTTRS